MSVLGTGLGKVRIFWVVVRRPVRQGALESPAGLFDLSSRQLFAFLIKCLDR